MKIWERTIGVLATAVTALTLLGGCATLFTPATDTISITSDPEGAEVYLDGKLLGKTPLTFVADREVFKQKFLTVKKAGYEPKQQRLRSTLNTASLFNLTSGPSWTTDAISGAMFEYSPKSYIILLTPKGEKAQLSDEQMQHRHRMAFVALHFNSLRNEIARGHGEHLDSFCHVMPLKHLSPKAFAGKIYKMRSQLLESHTPVELLQGMTALAG
jgi:hypothetical protein